MQSLSGVKRQMLPVPATGLRSGLMFAARVRELRSRSLSAGLAGASACTDPELSEPWDAAERTLSLNPGMPKIPEGRPEAGPLLAGRVPWP